MACAKLSLLILRPVGDFLIVVDVLRQLQVPNIVCHYCFDRYDVYIAFTNFGSLSYDEVAYDQ